jgi:hypothetical protein
MDRKQKIEEAVKKLKNEGARRISLFGSYARGAETSSSDMDILVDFGKTLSLMEYVRMQLELEDSLGISVDLLTREELSPYMIEDIEKQEIILHEER